MEDLKLTRRLPLVKKRKEPAESLIGYSKSYERHEKDSEENRISPKFFADKLPSLPKKRNGKLIAKPPTIQGKLIEVFTVDPEQDKFTEAAIDTRKEPEKSEFDTTVKAKQEKDYRYHLPEKVIVVLPDITVKASHIEGFTINRLKYLISAIVTHPQDDHPGAYSVLYMWYLNNVVRRANQYMNLLRDEGLIEWINYSEGRNSRMYRITKRYAGNVQRETITDKRLIRKIEENIAKIKLQNSKKYPILNNRCTGGT
jgi:hypothetical protein